MQSFKLLPILVVSVICFRCAHQGAPGGGPEDKVRPFVTEVFPASGAIDVPRNIEITAVFSEWVSPDASAGAVYVSPARPGFKTRVSGCTVRIVPDSLLMDGTTYVVTLGTSIRDLRGNAMERAYPIAFSTGSRLDSGVIRGRVFDAQARLMPAGYPVFAYLLSDTAVFDATNMRPDYSTQVNADGTFAFFHLRMGAYRVIGFRDLNNNLKFNPGREDGVAGSRDILLSPPCSQDSGLALWPAVSDTARLELSRVIFRAGGFVEVFFSKLPVKAEATDTSFYRLEPAGRSAGDALYPLLAAQMPFDSLGVLLMFGQGLVSGRYRLCVGPAMRAAGGRPSDTSRLSLEVAVNGLPDTTAPLLLFSNPSGNRRDFGPSDSITLGFSEPVRQNQLTAAFRLERVVIVQNRDDSLKPDTLLLPVRGRGYFMSPLEFVFKPDTVLPQRAVFRWSIPSLSVADLAGNYRPDSGMTGRFSTSNPDDLGAVSGRVEALSLDNAVLELFSRTGRKKVVSRPDKNGYFIMTSLPEDAYRLVFFRDKDGDGRFTAGALYPFGLSEPADVVLDSLTVRKRWETEGLVLKPEF